MSRIPFTPKQRFEILERDGFACQYCGGRAPNVQLVVDRVVPVAHGGFYESATQLPLNHGNEIRALYNHLVDDSAERREVN